MDEHKTGVRRLQTMFPAYSHPSRGVRILLEDLLAQVTVSLRNEERPLVKNYANTGTLATIRVLDSEAPKLKKSMSI